MNADIISVKDIFIIVGFVGGLIGIYIKNQIDLTKFKTETNLKMKMYDKEINTIKLSLEDQKIVQHEILLDMRETKTIVSSMVKLLDKINDKLDNGRK